MESSPQQCTDATFGLKEKTKKNTTVKKWADHPAWQKKCIF
jgi:hypothetical protein